jgi:hypothetical protein
MGLRLKHEHVLSRDSQYDEVKKIENRFSRISLSITHLLSLKIENELLIPVQR